MENLSSRDRERIKIRDEMISQIDKLGLLKLVNSDIALLGGWKGVFTNSGFFVVLGYRISHWLYRKRIGWLAVFVQVICVILFRSDFSRKAVVGPGFGLWHHQGLYIGPHVVIGQYVSIAGQGVFIGSNINSSNEYDYPVLEGNCRVSAGSKILGGIRVGKSVFLGPNSVIMKDVLEGVAVLPPTCRHIIRDDWVTVGK